MKMPYSSFIRVAHSRSKQSGLPGIPFAHLTTETSCLSPSWLRLVRRETALSGWVESWPAFTTTGSMRSRMPCSDWSEGTFKARLAETFSAEGPAGWHLSDGFWESITFSFRAGMEQRDDENIQHSEHIMQHDFKKPQTSQGLLRGLQSENIQTHEKWINPHITSKTSKYNQSFHRRFRVCESIFHFTQTHQSSSGHFRKIAKICQQMKVNSKFIYSQIHEKMSQNLPV